MGIQTALKREDCRSVTKNQDEILHTNFVFIGGGVVVILLAIIVVRNVAINLLLDIDIVFLPCAFSVAATCIILADS